MQCFMLEWVWCSYPCFSVRALGCFSVVLRFNGRNCSTCRSKWKPGPIVSVHYMSAFCYNLSHWLQRASKLPRDKGPFLEMLLNHHNPPKVFAFKVLLVSPHQLHSWQSLAVEPNLFKGGAQLRCLHRLWGGLLKISRYKGVFSFELAPLSFQLNIH